MMMTKREKLWIVAIAAIFLVVGFSLGQMSSVFGSNVAEQTKQPGGIFTVEVWRDGKLTLQETHNLVVTIGRTKARDYFSVGSTDITKFLALSNDATPLVSWTKLPGEVVGSGLDRAAGTVSNVNSTAYQTLYTWTATATVTVQCTGVHWIITGNSDNNLYAAGTFTQVTLNDLDTIKITYTLNFG
jgi:hypothetical protein